MIGDLESPAVTSFFLISYAFIVLQKRKFPVISENLSQRWNFSSVEIEMYYQPRKQFQNVLPKYHLASYYTQVFQSQKKRTSQ
jgi:hypothetical protein